MKRVSKSLMSHVGASLYSRGTVSVFALILLFAPVIATAACPDQGLKKAQGQTCDLAAHAYFSSLQKMASDVTKEADQVYALLGPTRIKQLADLQASLDRLSHHQDRTTHEFHDVDEQNQHTAAIKKIQDIWNQFAAEKRTLAAIQDLNRRGFTFDSEKTPFIGFTVSEAYGPRDADDATQLQTCLATAKVNARARKACQAAAQFQKDHADPGWKITAHRSNNDPTTGLVPESTTIEPRYGADPDDSPNDVAQTFTQLHRNEIYAKKDPPGMTPTSRHLAEAVLAVFTTPTNPNTKEVPCATNQLIDFYGKQGLRTPDEQKAYEARQPRIKPDTKDDKDETTPQAANTSSTADPIEPTAGDTTAPSAPVGERTFAESGDPHDFGGDCYVPPLVNPLEPQGDISDQEPERFYCHHCSLSPFEEGKMVADQDNLIKAWHARHPKCQAAEDLYNNTQR